MKLKKFRIVSPRDVQSTDNVFETLLINTDHIISVKPIKIVIEEKVVQGYWIRTTNGKKYRAVDVPPEIKDLLSSDRKLEIVTDANNVDHTPPQLLN